MAFSISFLPESCQEIEHDSTEAVGEIVLGEFRTIYSVSLFLDTSAV